MRKIKIQSILAAIAGLLLATGCSSSFLLVIVRFSVWMT